MDIKTLTNFLTFLPTKTKYTRLKEKKQEKLLEGLKQAKLLPIKEEEELLSFKDQLIDLLISHISSEKITIDEYFEFRNALIVINPVLLREIHNEIIELLKEPEKKLMKTSKEIDAICPEEVRNVKETIMANGTPTTIQYTRVVKLADTLNYIVEIDRKYHQFITKASDQFKNGRKEDSIGLLALACDLMKEKDESITSLLESLYDKKFGYLKQSGIPILERQSEFYKSILFNQVESSLRTTYHYLSLKENKEQELKFHPAVKRHMSFKER